MNVVSLSLLFFCCFLFSVLGYCVCTFSILCRNFDLIQDWDRISNGSITLTTAHAFACEPKRITFFSLCDTIPKCITKHLLVSNR